MINLWHQDFLMKQIFSKKIFLLIKTLKILFFPKIFNKLRLSNNIKNKTKI